MKYTIDNVERDLQYCKKLVYKKIIDPILPDKAQREYFLKCLARSLAGHFNMTRNGMLDKVPEIVVRVY
jgi:hypothetical protein